jgi:hypothetical protein
MSPSEILSVSIFLYNIAVTFKLTLQEMKLNSGNWIVEKNFQHRQVFFSVNKIRFESLEHTNNPGNLMQ